MTLVTMYKRPVNPATKNTTNPKFSQKWPPTNADFRLMIFELRWRLGQCCANALFMPTYNPYYLK